MSKRIGELCILLGLTVSVFATLINLIEAANIKPSHERGKIVSISSPDKDGIVQGIVFFDTLGEYDKVSLGEDGFWRVGDSFTQQELTKKQRSRFSFHMLLTLVFGVATFTMITLMKT